MPPHSLTLLAAAALISGSGAAAAQFPAPTPTTAQTEPTEITRNVRMLAAGDAAITVRMDGRTTVVRLLGVGDPGADAGDRAPCLREDARAGIEAVLPVGKSVTLSLPSEDRDAQGRLQGWAYPGGGSGSRSVNWKLVQRGLAPAADGAAGLRYGTELTAAETVARKARNGRWGEACTLSTIRGIQRRLISLGYLPAGAVNDTLDYRTQQAVMAFQGWSGLPRVGTVDTTTRKRLAKASRPVPWNRAKKGRRIEVHIDRQVLLLVDRGVVARAIHVSTGAGGRTPTGAFSVLRRERYSWSRPFSVSLPFAQYFHGGFAFHEYPSVPGYPASHGCVRLPYPEAPVVWDFSTWGTPVTIA